MADAAFQAARLLSSFFKTPAESRWRAQKPDPTPKEAPFDLTRIRAL
jgi:hypothetical protein